MSGNRLGRGLSALFQEHDIESIEQFQQIKEGEVVEQLPLSSLRPNPYQPRKYFDESKIAELASSIRDHGVFQPIIVKKDIRGYIIIAGERRFRAAKKAGLKTIPAIVRDFNDSLMMEYALIENLQREDLTPIEEAEAYRMLMQKLDLTQEKLAERIGKSRAYVANTMRLLQLPRMVQDAIENNEISVGHAKVLAGLKDHELIKKFAEIVKDKQISVRELEELIRHHMAVKAEEKKQQKLASNQHLESVESILKAYFGTKVKIKENHGNGRGQIIIDYMTTDDLNRLLDMMGIE
jgi:ParB family chromosome partitioning protein